MKYDIALHACMQPRRYTLPLSISVLSFNWLHSGYQDSAHFSCQAGSALRSSSSSRQLKSQYFNFLFFCQASTLFFAILHIIARSVCPVLPLCNPRMLCLISSSFIDIFSFNVLFSNFALLNPFFPSLSLRLN